MDSFANQSAHNPLMSINNTLSPKYTPRRYDRPKEDSIIIKEDL